MQGTPHGEVSNVIRDPGQTVEGPRDAVLVPQCSHERQALLMAGARLRPIALIEGEVAQFVEHVRPRPRICSRPCQAQHLCEAGSSLGAVATDLPEVRQGLTEPEAELRLVLLDAEL